MGLRLRRDRPEPRLDAVRHALSANAQHGKRREPGDYRKGYEIAVRCGLCEAHDVEAVRALLACSKRWAEELTQPAREAAKAERDARIVEARKAGETQAQIAAREGISQPQVSRALQDYTKAQSARTHTETDGQEDAPPPAKAPAAPFPPEPPIPSAQALAAAMKRLNRPALLCAGSHLCRQHRHIVPKGKMSDGRSDLAKKKNMAGLRT